MDFSPLPRWEVNTDQDSVTNLDRTYVAHSNELLVLNVFPNHNRHPTRVVSVAFAYYTKSRSPYLIRLDFL